MRTKVIASIVAADGSNLWGDRKKTMSVGFPVENKDEVGLSMQSVCKKEFEVSPGLYALAVNVCHKWAVGRDITRGSIGRLTVRAKKH